MGLSASQCDSRQISVMGAAVGVLGVGEKQAKYVELSLSYQQMHRAYR